ncbi:UNVERIFIED_ORG: type 1 fimbria pilin [Buttiauxella agrestis ATCC 33320]
MKRFLGSSLLTVLVLSAFGAQAATTGNNTATMSFTGEVLPTQDNCSIAAPATLNLGSVDLLPLEKMTPASETSEAKAFTVKISGCGVGQRVQLHFNAVEDTYNPSLFANSTAVGNAKHAGVVIHEHATDGSVSLINPEDGVSSESLIGDDGEAVKSFTANISPEQNGMSITAGKIAVTATMTLETI